MAVAARGQEFVAALMRGSHDQAQPFKVGLAGAVTGLLAALRLPGADDRRFAVPGSLGERERRHLEALVQELRLALAEYRHHELAVISEIASP